MKYFNRKRISWANFEAANEDKRTAFEDMCRLLFCDKFLDSKTIPHSRPNNPGVEIEPIMDKNSRKLISFQSKYFDCLNSDCYRQIRHSAENAIKNYKNKLDRIYLYCNKDLTTTSKQYKDIVSLLQTANIELNLITNSSILNEVIKNEVAATYFFFSHGISEEWFKEQVSENLSSLGAKYNKDLDVNTPISNQIELFSLSDNAVKTINNRKAEAIKQIKDSRWRYSDYSQTINSLCELILSLPDVNTSDLNYRDYIWTLCVNDMSDEDRLVQIVEYFDNGHSLGPLDSESVKLLLILLSWILTSSNRYLRDKTSKAMVELLKNNFELCEYMLRKFESVNDPYVSQRLFCVVFGACVKRESEHKHEYTQLVNYVYTRIFKQEKVFPDILLRDYARLIIERFLYEFPNELDIDVSIIIPPYNSDAIPTVDKEDYYKKESLYSGFNRIYFSMLPNLPNRPAASSRIQTN